MKRLIVAGLEGTCTLLDKALPRVPWCRWFAKWSSDLDDRWHTGHWKPVEEEE